MTTSPEKLQELNAVVQFWKFRVDELRRHLDKVLAHQTAQQQSYMVPLIEMKTRELADSQRGLRKAQATLGQLSETAGIQKPTVGVEPEVESLEADALPVPEPEPVPPRDRRPLPNGLSRFPLSEFKPGTSHRHAL